MISIYHGRAKVGDGSNQLAEEEGNKVVEPSTIDHKEPLQFYFK